MNHRAACGLVVDLHPEYLTRFIRITAVLAMPADRQEEWLATFNGGGLGQ